MFQTLKLLIMVLRVLHITFLKFGKLYQHILTKLTNLKSPLKIESEFGIYVYEYMYIHIFRTLSLTYILIRTTMYALAKS